MSAALRQGLNPPGDPADQVHLVPGSARFAHHGRKPAAQFVHGHLLQDRDLGLDVRAWLARFPRFGEAATPIESETVMTCPLLRKGWLWREPARWCKHLVGSSCLGLTRVNPWAH